MSYTFTNKPFVWTKTGAEPTEAELALGLQGGMGLPAAFVNEQWRKTYLALKELQERLELESTMFIGDALNVGAENWVATTVDPTNPSKPNYYAVIGVGNTVNYLNTVVGKYSKTPTAATPTANTGDLFVVGNGIEGGAKSNALRVTGAGAVMGTQSYAATGADFAECFEWADGNPENADRRGLFVTLDGEKIRPASADDDYILGVVSATPTVIGDASTDDWHGKYVTDVFGARVLENGAYKLAEGFDESLDDNYTSRLDRPEWAAVGLVGKVVVVDDGTCEVNSYCKPSKHGVATASDAGYRVMARIDTNHVKVLLK